MQETNQPNLKSYFVSVFDSQNVTFTQRADLAQAVAENHAGTVQVYRVDADSLNQVKYIYASGVSPQCNLVYYKGAV